MNEEIQRHYQQLFQEHGDSPQAVQWSDARSQVKRFEILSGVSAELGSVVDLGCGLGHFRDYLRTSGFAGRYLGLDMVKEFVDRGREKHARDPLSRFELCNLATDEYPDNHDTHFVCGVFNNRMPNNQEFMRSVIVKAFSAARRQVAFNAMSVYVDFQAPDLYYSDPLELFDFCKRNLTRRVTLRHDYLVRDDRPPFEYTMYLYK